MKPSTLTHQNMSLGGVWSFSVVVAAAARVPARAGRAMDYGVWRGVGGK
jgi:hypothetical protein